MRGIPCLTAPCQTVEPAKIEARPKAFYFACTRADAAAIDFDGQFIYDELKLPFAERQIPAFPLLREEGLKAFVEWQGMADKFVY